MSKIIIKHKYKVIIKKANKKYYNFMYIFIGKHKYVEYDTNRYFRILSYLNK